MAFFNTRRDRALLIHFRIEYLCFSEWIIWPVPGPFFVNPGTLHQLFDGVDRFAAIVDRLMVLTAHDDGFFRACVDAEPAVNAAHHVDVETARELFNFRVRMLTRFDVDAFGGTDGRTHVASDSFEAA